MKLNLKISMEGKITKNIVEFYNREKLKEINKKKYYNCCLGNLKNNKRKKKKSLKNRLKI